MISFQRHVLSALSLSLLVCACAVVPTSPPALVSAPTQYKETGTWRKASSEASPVPDAWWLLFNDSILNDLERRVVIGNENLKVSIAQLASSRAVLEASRSATLPLASAGLSATRSASSAASSAALQNPGNVVGLSASASWELDVWGRLAQASAGAQAGYHASANDLAAATLSLQALLAQAYFSLRSQEAQQSLLGRSVQAYQRALDLIHVRRLGGVAALADELQAQTQLVNAQSQLAEVVAQRALLEHAIAVLLGVSPSTFSIAPTAKVPPTVLVPMTLPSELLQRRPDIAAAQQRVAAANAQVGVADAAFFPALSLSSTVGYNQTSFANLVSAPNLVWSLGTTLAHSIFDGGQHKLASAQARSSFEQATAIYRQLVLTSLQEVEDNLILSAQLQKEVELQTQALQSAQRSLEITMDQYRAGTVSYLNVAVAQNVALTTESALLSTRNRQLASVNQLLKNIAGRWQDVDLVPEDTQNGMSGK